MWQFAYGTKTRTATAQYLGLASVGRPAALMIVRARGLTARKLKQHLMKDNATGEKFRPNQPALVSWRHWNWVDGPQMEFAVGPYIRLVQGPSNSCY